jgi:hypothetical protein
MILQVSERHPGEGRGAMLPRPQLTLRPRHRHLPDTRPSLLDMRLSVPGTRPWEVGSAQIQRDNGLASSDTPGCKYRRSA